MIKIKGPTPNGEVSHAGIRFKADHRGVLEIAEGNEAIARLLCETHGFVPFKEEAQAAAAAPAAPTKTADAISVDAASREELKTFLRAAGVEFAGNASNDSLRDMVRTEIALRGEAANGGDDAGGK